MTSPDIARAWLKNGGVPLIIQGVSSILRGTPAVTKRCHKAIRFTTVKRRRVEAEFTGAEVTSNGGAPLLAEADRRMGLTWAAAEAMGDDRRRRSVVHSTLAVLRQRVYALVLGHEDLNDHQRLRRDPALQAAAGRDAELASPSTLCRFERRSGPAEAMALHEVLFEQFVKAHPEPPKRIVLDFDATDVTLHSMQACTGCRRAATGTATTAATATCRCTSSPAGTCWRPCCSRAAGTRRGGRGRCWRCWWGRCAASGRTWTSCSGATAGSGASR